MQQVQEGLVDFVVVGGMCSIMGYDDEVVWLDIGMCLMQDVVQDVFDLVMFDGVWIDFVGNCQIQFGWLVSWQLVQGYQWIGYMVGVVEDC